MTRRNWFAIGAGIVLSLIFLAAGLGKLLNPMESSIIFVFPEFLPTAVDKFIFRWLPRIEILIGVLLVVGIVARLVASLALALTVSLIANNGILLVQGFGDKPKVTEEIFVLLIRVSNETEANRLTMVEISCSKYDSSSKSSQCFSHNYCAKSRQPPLSQRGMPSHLS